MKRVLLPLHPAQRDVYTDQLIHPASPHYNIGGFIKLKGALNKQMFSEAVNSIVDVFDTFKFRFVTDEAGPRCYLDERGIYPQLTELDFSAYSNPAMAALEWMQQNFSTPISISENAPLFNVRLLKLADDEYWFFGKFHHLVTDGYGFILIVKYYAQKYQSLVSGEQLQLAYPSYQDEIINAAAYFNSTEYVTDSNYWKDKIGSVPEKMLAAKYQPNNKDGKTSATYLHPLKSCQRKILNDLKVQTKSGIQQITIAAMLIYFGKISDHSSFVFGVPVHKRGSRKLRNTVGMFSGILPFRGEFKKDKILSELFHDITLSLKNDYRHQNYPISELGRNLKISQAENSLYDISINYEPFNMQLDLGGHVHAEIHRLQNDNNRNPLQLFWIEYGDGESLQLEVQYGKTSFNEQEIKLFINRIMFIIEQFPASLDKGLGEIEILPPAEKELLEKFNTTSRHYPGFNTMVGLFEAQVLKTPQNIALTFEGQQLTYDELNKLANQLAHYLKNNGVIENTLIPLCVKRSVEMLVGILAVLKAGGAYVPIDPEYPEDRISFMLKDINPAIIITTKLSADRLKLTGTQNSFFLDSGWHSISNLPTKNVNAAIKEDQLAYIIYTSGSTGNPKGVMIEHSAVVNLIHAQTAYFNIDSTERILQFSNYCFDASVEQIFLALFNGAALVMFPEGLQLNMEKFELFLNENQVTHLHTTPGFLESMPSIHFKSLKRVIAGGDTCKRELAEKWSTTVNFYNEYGPTETTVTAVEYNAGVLNTPVLISLPIGKPLANTQLFIADKNKAVMPVGVTGELYIAGAGVARGYLNRPGLTDEKFTHYNFGNTQNVRMYHTGDLARWLPDGNVEYLGRIDEQVKIRGYRIEPGEIENVLLQIESIKQAVVAAREDKDGSKRLIGFVVTNGLLNRDVIRDYLKKKLPDYMVPSIWVQVENIPLTVNGKIDRKALPNPGAGDVMNDKYEAPANKMEDQLAGVWRELMHLERVGVTDNFFELGGHSLTAIQLSGRVHKLLNLKIAVGTIFSNPTIRQLSKALLLENQNIFSEIKRLPLQEFYPVSHAQKRFWVLSYFKDGSAAYNVSNAFVVEGRLNVDAFKRAFNTVIERHEILRTVFIEIENEPWQKILSVKDLNFRIDEVDLQNENNSGEVIRQWVHQDSRRAFDLLHGPLLRAVIFREAPRKFILVFTIHHIISDGWSKGIFVNEVLHLYNTYCAGGENKLVPLPVQYKSYAAWHSGIYEMQGQYWRNLYAKGIPALNFPVDFERPKILTFFGAMLQLQIPPALTQGLRSKAIEHNTSLNNLLFALYGLLVAGYSGQEELVIGSLSSGRSHIDLENLIGVFINFLPVRLSLKKDLDLTTYINNTHTALTGAYNNQDYPFDLMVDDCIRQRDISRNPFFDTMVNFHLEKDLHGKDAFGKKEITGSEISLSPYEASGEDLYQSVLDFKMDIELTDGTLHLFLSYNSKLFLKETMNSFLNEFVALLTMIVNEPGKYLSEYVNWKKEESFLPPDTANDMEALPALPLNICASFVMEPVQEYVQYWSNEFCLNIELSFAPYNQVFQQLIHPQSLLNSGKGINVLFIRVEDWLKDKTNTSQAEQAILLNQIKQELIDVIEKNAENNFVLFLVAVVPFFRAHSFAPAIAEEINKINADLEIFIQQQPRFQLLSIEKIARLYDVAQLFDAKGDEVGHMPFTPELYAAIGTYLARKVNAFKGQGYKVIALDCDNTLWQGVCGEVGATGVVIDENFKYLQQFAVEKYNEGFLLVLCSKNNEADVWEVFDSNPGMLLKREHIAAHRINWQAKPGNLLSLANELNLGVNSFIFLDDSEFETEQMNDNCPEVLVIALPENPDEFKSFLDHIWAFDIFSLTVEDAKRNQMYQVEKQRKEEQVKFGSLEDFLSTLNIEVTINPLTHNELERAVQLTVRTNQFNLNGIRKTSGEIAALISQLYTLNWIIEVKDRFGDYGISGVMLAKETGNSLVVETFLLSCRVLGRNVEDYILSSLQQYCRDRNLNSITVVFITTEKNKPFHEFLVRTNWLYTAATGTYDLLVKNSE